MLQKNEIGNEKAKYIRIAVLVIYDMIAIFLAEVLSIWTRFDFSLKNEKEFLIWRLRCSICGSIL